MMSSIWVDFAGQSSADAGHAPKATPNVNTPKVNTTASPAGRDLEIIASFSSVNWCVPNDTTSAILSDVKNRILLENYYLPGDLKAQNAAQIARFVAHYNRRRYQESLQNLTPADVCFRGGQTRLRAFHQ
jgi:hypothetical protein